MIRQATVRDLDDICRLQQALFAEDGPDIPTQRNPEPFMRKQLEAVLWQGELGVVFVAEEDGRVIGMVGVLVRAGHPYLAPHAEGWGLYVDHGHRKNTHGPELVKAAVRWVESAGLSHFTIQATYGRRVVSLFRRYGFEPASMTMVRHSGG